MKRFYLTIYLALLGILLLFSVSVALLWHLGSDENWGESRRDKKVRALSALVADSVPPITADRAQLQAWLDRMADSFAVRIGLFSSHGRLIARSGEAVSPPDISRDQGGVDRNRHGMRIDIKLPDGRWLSAFHPWREHSGTPKWLVALLLLAAAVGVGAYPVARRITRRVERLQSRVDALGGGDLSVRVEIEGKDEIAGLARSFNRAAERIEALVEGQRDMLASASHELRSPLTRIRMGLELLDAGERTALKERLNRDIDELDELIEELLFASRLETRSGDDVRESVDLLALLAEECARTGADADGESVEVPGDPKLLRRLIRNLLENAVRHGGGSPVTASVHAVDTSNVRLCVMDEGPGVPAAEREKIFEPFYRPAGMAEGPEGGVGLGLALVRRIAERHGGTVICEALSQGGSKFVVELPAKGRA
jgi:signal transduction histidine kinase